jgi:hypothetical protein
MKRVNATPTTGLDRREFLHASAGVAALGILGWPHSADALTGDAWNQGQLTHLIPTANHERFLIKASFKAPLAETPRLTVNGKAVDGVRTDPQGRFWRFDAPSLQSATQYELRITDSGGAPLCDAWPLKTRKVRLYSLGEGPVAYRQRKMRHAWISPAQG